MAGRKHLIAVNRAIKAADLDTAGLDAPIVELVRELARQMDAAGPDGPSQRLLAAYLSATKDLRRATVRRPAPKPPESPVSESAAPVVMTGPVAVEESPLERVRRHKAQRRSA